MVNIDEQKLFYDMRWNNQNYVNIFCLQRLIAILEALHTTNISKPMILDLGCGRGWLTSILNQFGSTMGIELSPKAIQSARMKYPNVTFIDGDIFETVLEKNSFDIVVSREVIEHVDAQESYVEIAAECLRDGGYLIMTTPNAYNLNCWTQEGLEKWDLQPIEKWLTIQSLKKLVGSKLEIIYVKTIIPEFGSKGIFRLLNSVKLSKLLNSMKLNNLKNKLMLRFGMGLHIVVLARKK